MRPVITLCVVTSGCGEQREDQAVDRGELRVVEELFHELSAGSWDLDFKPNNQFKLMRHQLRERVRRGRAENKKNERRKRWEAEWLTGLVLYPYYLL